MKAINSFNDSTTLQLIVVSFIIFHVFLWQDKLNGSLAEYGVILGVYFAAWRNRENKKVTMVII